MSVKHTTDYAPLIDAVASTKVEHIAREVVHLLRRNVSPFFIIGNAGVPAAWGDTDGHPLCALAAGGHIADWMRYIPPSGDEDDEEQRLLQQALPLTAALAYAAPAVKSGERTRPKLPEPLFPANITHPQGMDGALREAVRAGQVNRTQQLLMGYYATGTDYRSYLANVYRAISEHYADDGHILLFAHRSSQVLDMAGWADKLPPFIYWLTPHLASARPDAPFLVDVWAFLSDAAHDLKPLRTRLAPANDAAAGAELRQAILHGSVEETCAAVLAALRNGARGPAVGSVIALAAARRFLNTAESDTDASMRAAHGLLVASAARTAAQQIQDIEVLPILFIAAAAVNALRDVEQAEASQAIAHPRASVGGLVGGMLAPVLLRSLEQQLEGGDEQAAQTSARRYLQLGHPTRGLVATIASVACQGDASSDAGHTLLLAQAAAEEYLALPPHLQSEGETLLAVGVRAATHRPQATHIVEAVQRAGA
ncbi:MAG TPA: hypothetical protein VFU69_01225 [Ktedonobacterales bacterium]|nr:hypothetical protein [Ktedonobacterales bacterium]